ncbi:MAG: lipid IV(A) 3-deoxy-D-manno-octulosonic acid transferase [Ottowia sp.]|nr:lipid IV(A) 3-deoxy-D-manno-octulosonic acid transferase [Ottowia sp.]
MKYVRYLYALLWLCVLPLVLLRLIWRSRDDPGYRHHMRERLGCYPPLPSVGNWIWIHAVSVGETYAAQPLVQTLLTQYPNVRIVLTHMTPTGRKTGSALFAEYIRQGRMQQVYAPYDFPWFVQRFFRHIRPSLGLLIETEVWPNFVWIAQTYNIPLALINARMSPRSFKRATYLTCIQHAARQLFGAIPLILAQTQTDAARLRELGGKQVEICGNLKFDRNADPLHIQQGLSLRKRIGTRWVLCAASTREGEETLILNAWQQFQQTHAHHNPAHPCTHSATDPANHTEHVAPPLLLLVPRHPQRFSEVAHIVHKHGLTYALRSALPSHTTSSHWVIPPTTQVLIGDSLGEMASYYSACDIALIGGSLLPFGGQNLIEACALGKPILLGPHTFNFYQASKDAVAEGAAIQMTHTELLAQHIHDLFNDPARLARMGQASQRFAQTYRGATTRITHALLPYLPD